MAENTGTLVNNVWNNTKDKTLATQDVYTAPAESVVSAAPAVAETAANKTRSLLKTTAQSIRTVAKAVKAVNEFKKAVSSGDVFSRITAGAPALKAALGAAGISSPEALTKYIDTAATIGTKVGGVYREVKAVDFNSVDAAGKLLAKYTGDNELFKVADAGASGALALGVINACVSNGIPNSVPAVLGIFSEDGALNKVVGGALPLTISKSDYECLNDLTDAVGSNVLKAISPTIAADFASAFNKPLYWKDGKFKDLSESLSNADYAWNVGSIASETTVDLTTVINGSDDFKSVVTEGAITTPNAEGKITTDQTMLAFGTVFNKTTVESELKTTFPLTVVSISTVNRDEVVNPLLVGSI